MSHLVWENERKAHTWVVLQRSLAIRGFDFICSRGLLDAQNLVRLNGGRLLILKFDILFTWHFAGVVDGMRVSRFEVLTWRMFCLWRDASEIWREWLRVKWTHFFNDTKEEFEFKSKSFSLSLKCRKSILI